MTKKKENDPVAHADKAARENMNKLAANGATVHDLGITVLTLGEGGLVYCGRTYRLENTPYGEVAVVLEAFNPRAWGCTQGRAEMAWGSPDRSRWDPAPGVIVPWSRVLAIMPVTSGWTPRDIAD